MTTKIIKKEQPFFRKMKFAHLADCHLGCWREEELKRLPLKAFARAINKCLKEKVDFVIISGDLFDSPLPPIDLLKKTVQYLRKLKEEMISVYLVSGSHDYSVSGKTFLEVLEKAGLAINVAKGKVIEEKLHLQFTQDKKTGAKITGLFGKSKGTEKEYYQQLAREELEKEEGFKIFVYHSALKELMPKELAMVESLPFSYLPQNFDYYAGGHIHLPKELVKEGKNKKMRLVQPGPIFPCSFTELEKLARGGFYIYDQGELKFEPLQVCSIFSIIIQSENKTPEQIENEIMDQIKNKEFYETVVTIRLKGEMKGKSKEIDFKNIIETLYDKSAYYVKISTSKLEQEELKEIKIDVSSLPEVEEQLIKEHLGGMTMPGKDEKETRDKIKELMRTLSREKEEGQTKTDYQKEVLSESSSFFESAESTSLKSGTTESASELPESDTSGTTSTDLEGTGLGESRGAESELPESESP